MRRILHVAHAEPSGTELQATVNGSREALLGNGVLYRASPNERHNNHKLGFVDLLPPERVLRHIAKNSTTHEVPAGRDELLDPIRAEIARHRPDRLVLSAETRFGNWQPEPRRRFVEMLRSMAAAEPAIVACVRRLSGYILSFTQRRLRFSYEVKILRCLFFPRPVMRIRHDLGTGRVHVREFALGLLRGGGVVTDFVAGFLPPRGVRLEDPAAGRNENASCSAEPSDALRRYRRTIYRGGNDRFTSTRWVFLGAFDRAETSPALPRPRVPWSLVGRIDHGRPDLLVLCEGRGLELPDRRYGRLGRWGADAASVEGPASRCRRGHRPRRAAPAHRAAARRRAGRGRARDGSTPHCGDRRRDRRSGASGRVAACGSRVTR